jgi:hypothetical protein
VEIRRRRWVILVIAVVGLTIAALVSLATQIPITSSKMRAAVVAALARELDAEVELRDLSVRIYPRLHAEGGGLTIRHKARHDVPPLISIDKFDVDADLMGLWRRHVAHVNVHGLDIQIPPDDDDDQADPKASSRKADPDAPKIEAGNSEDRAAGKRNDERSVRQMIVDEVETPEARLVILRRDLTKEPRTWYLHKLRMHSVGTAMKMPFESILTNAVPPGQIKTKGHFGPWHTERPGRTPLDGEFTFADADLSVFKGISGILSAKGTYGGSLERIEVKGETDTPDFMVNVSGHKVPLKTSYHAIVDGTNGNTTLDPVNGTILNSSLIARGGVYDEKTGHGRIVRLDVTMDNARLEDMMRLAVKAPKPPMVGALRLSTKFVLPPGEQDVVHRLQLDGRFAIEGGRFTDPPVQAKVNELSLRASGKMENTASPQPAAKVASDFTGRFKLADGVLVLPKVTFDVPGALVELAGSYALQPEAIDFKGNLYMDAKVSQTVTGFKSLLLKVVDPIFRKDGHTVIPIRISGSRNDPQFGLDVRRVFRRGEQDAGPVGTKGTAPKR